MADKSIKKLADTIIKVVDERLNQKPKSYDTQAVVRRIDPETGEAFVHIPNGIDETPVRLTVDASVGDTVQVRVADGRAWLTGNRTAPPTDDTVAKEAETKAVKAEVKAEDAQTTASEAEQEAGRAKAAADDAHATAEAVHGIAEQAQTDAGIAKTNAQTAITNAGIAKQAADAANGLLGDMQDAATQAGTTLTGIYADAETAKTNAQTAITNAQTAITNAGLAQTAASQAKASAENASEYAARALGNLSTVQNVTETLNWITAHGTMALTSDQQLDPTHVYFVIDPAGDYTVGGQTYSIVTEPDVADIGTYYELSIDESLNNYVATHLAVDGEGLWLLPDSGGNRVLIATGAGSAYTSAGTYIIDNSGNTVASFRTNGATIGETANGKSRTEIGTDGMHITQHMNGSDVQIADLGFGNGNSDSGSSWAPYYTFGVRGPETIIQPYDPGYPYSAGDICSYNGANYVCWRDTPDPAGAFDTDYWMFIIGNYSVAEGFYTIAYGTCSHAEGQATEARGIDSHVEGEYSIANSYAHAECRQTKAMGICSHAEGYQTEANGNDSHAEGYSSKAYGGTSHAEGVSVANGYGAHSEGDSYADDDYSHSEGYKTEAYGAYSHTQNQGTHTSYDSQTALGKYNEYTNSSDYAVMIGNGSYTWPGSPIRSNAMAVTWDGDVHMYIDTTAQSGTDYDLYSAISVLGWASDVII